jgi:hypothetical protein
MESDYSDQENEKLPHCPAIILKKEKALAELK